ncbi:hypothetical protein HNY73_018018 [Argiope bruennichi]|uniref:Uncharacterized protein n=1 Tax=Argiope bruennichi TaxID=94029 RepID=A0A8T0ECN4_ARGBR|nr:hypothetical protein HNY73_018018 [Argiope bruennichi]
MPTKEWYGLFTFDKFVKNTTVHPLNGFETDYVDGAECEVPMHEMETFLTGRFYQILQRDADTWKEIIIGTYDMATFLLLEPMLLHKVVYLGPRIDVEQTVQMQVESNKN